MVYVDIPFLLAIAAAGFGLSLLTYRAFARRYEWPMGKWHADHPSLPTLIGLASFLVALYFSASRWLDGSMGPYGAAAVVAFGLSLAILWTGLLRVASQLSLLLAPASAGLLMFTWAFGTAALQYTTLRSEFRTEMQQLRRDLHDQFGLKPRDGAAARPPQQ